MLSAISTVVEEESGDGSTGWLSFIRANVPLAEIFRYSVDLAPLPKGEGLIK